MLLKIAASLIVGGTHIAIANPALTRDSLPVHWSVSRMLECCGCRSRFHQHNIGHKRDL